MPKYALAFDQAQSVPASLMQSPEHYLQLPIRPHLSFNSYSSYSTIMEQSLTVNDKTRIRQIMQQTDTNTIANTVNGLSFDKIGLLLEAIYETLTEIGDVSACLGWLELLVKKNLSTVSHHRDSIQKIYKFLQVRRQVAERIIRLKVPSITPQTQEYQYVPKFYYAEKHNNEGEDPAQVSDDELMDLQS